MPLIFSECVAKPREGLVVCNKRLQESQECTYDMPDVTCQECIRIDEREACAAECEKWFQPMLAELIRRRS